jgi:hypothetical protein
MSIERWHTQKQWRATLDHMHDLRELERLSPVYVEIEDTDTGGTLHTIRHGLRRVPRGVRIVNAVLGTNTYCTCHRLDTDDAWTDEKMTLRFTADNARVLLEVF